MSRAAPIWTNQNQTVLHVDQQGLESLTPPHVYQSRGLVKASGKSSFTTFVDLGMYQSPGSTGDNISVTGSRFEQLKMEVRKGSMVNVNPTNTRPPNDTPEIRKYKKRFNSEILCAALWGVNLLVGTENGLKLLDRSGQGKVYPLINSRRFQQMDVLEGLNLLITISGKKNKVRVYYLAWLRNKILHNDPEVEKKQGWTTVGEMEGCVHYKVVKYERIKFLVIALKNAVEVYAWAPKPYHKFMAFKSFADLPHRPVLVDLTVEEGQRLKVIYGSCAGFHAIDVDSGNNYDIYIPVHIQSHVTPHAIVFLPSSDGMEMLLCYEDEGVYVNTYGRIIKDVVLQWGEMPTSVAHICSNQIMGWGEKAIEIRSVETGHLDGVFMHKRAQRLKFLCERNDKVFFASVRSGGSSQVYFMTLNRNCIMNWSSTCPKRLLSNISDHVLGGAHLETPVTSQRAAHLSTRSLFKKQYEHLNQSAASPVSVLSPVTLTPSPSPVTLTPSPVTLATSPVTLTPSPVTLATSPVTLATSPVTLATSPVTLAPSPVTLATSPVTCHFNTVPCHSDTVPCHSGTITCHSGNVTCHFNTVTCHSDTVPCHSDTVTCHSGNVTCHSGNVTCHSGTVTCHSGTVTCHSDTVTCQACSW
ncbi:Misshapen-like kinase 1 [Collichthys lucidus]|uniref:non-specific serine/threonine protein kinase n=1 Tax=Collichthys lucidus TaxID=240159 RepID=A0A4U5V836_COLLU|nr:Misshapen-like kinase 1 [Collichthys lucidus]